MIAPLKVFFRNNLSGILVAWVIWLSIPTIVLAADTASGTILPPAFLQGSDTVIILKPVEIPEPPRGKGKLSISIETFNGENPKRVGQIAERAELWLGDKRISSLNKDDSEVVSEKNRRIFIFPEIELDNGYYFITVRLYSPGAFHGRQKSYEQTFQVGIHPDKSCKVYKKMPFFHW